MVVLRLGREYVGGSFAAGMTLLGSQFCRDEVILFGNFMDGMRPFGCQL